MSKIISYIALLTIGVYIALMSFVPSSINFSIIGILTSFVYFFWKKITNYKIIFNIAFPLIVIANIPVIWLIIEQTKYDVGLGIIFFASFWAIFFVPAFVLTLIGCTLIFAKWVSNKFSKKV